MADPTAPPIPQEPSVPVGSGWARHRRVIIGLGAVVVLLVASLATLVIVQRDDAAGPTRAQPARFYVVGSDIVDPQGHLFRPLGANVGTTGSFDWRGKADGHAADAVTWGWNTVRLNVNCTNEASYSVRFNDGYETLRRRVAKVIAEYTARQIVVVIACHDPYGKIYADEAKSKVRLTASDPKASGKNLSDQGATYLQQMDGFWTDAADDYKTNPYVWFNFWNEPFGNDNADFVAMNTHFYELVRARGAENMAVVDLMNSGNDAAANGAKHVFDPSMGPALAAGKCNLLFSLHAYGWGNNARTYAALFQKMRDLQLPIMVGEFGYKLGTPATDVSRAAADAMVELAPRYDVGLVVWHATFGDDFSLKASGRSFYADGGDDAALSPLGEQLWGLGHPVPDVRTFPGDVADSHCQSAAASG